MAVDDLVADQSQRCQPRTVAMFPPTPPAERPFFQRPEGISPFRSVFAGLSAATAALLRLAKNYGVRSETVQDDTRHLVLDLGAHLQ